MNEGRSPDSAAKPPQLGSRLVHYAVLTVVAGAIAVGIAYVSVMLTPETSGELPPPAGQSSGGSIMIDAAVFSLAPGRTYSVSRAVPVLAELEPPPGAEGETPPVAEVPAGGTFTVVDTATRSGGETLYSVRVGDAEGAIEGWIHPVSLMGLQVTDTAATE